MTIVGLPQGKLLKSKETFFRDDVGLERIVVEFFMRTEDRATLSTAVFTNYSPYGLAYNLTIQKQQAGISISTTIPFGPGSGYNYMVIERADYEDLTGGITLVRATYVGLLTTQEPKPKIEITPVSITNNYIHNKYQIVINFVQFVGIPNSETEKEAIARMFGTTDGFYFYPPRAISQQPIPLGIVQPYSLTKEEWDGQFGGLGIDKANLSWNTCLFTGQQDVDPLEGGTEFVELKGTIRYLGFTTKNMTVKRYGYFAVVGLEVRESAYVNGFGPVAGSQNSPFCFSALK